jgi:L-lysine 2,3-aminomutase
MKHSPAPSAPWQRTLREAVRTWPELAAMLELPEHGSGGFTPKRRDFPLLVPRGYIARMRQRDPLDPLLLQVLPRAAERDTVPGYGNDPVAEVSLAASGVLRKYRGRALLITTGSCPVHCRYCFRRAFPYSAQLAARGDFAPALRAIAADTSINEIILSGGDPLSLSNDRLAALFDRLAAIPWLRTVRIHTRFPIMIPERIDDELCAMLDHLRGRVATMPEAGCRHGSVEEGTVEEGTADAVAARADERRAAGLRTVIVVHTNRANEIDTPVSTALRRLGSVSDAVLNQAVLLRGINDDAHSLAALSEALFDSGVLPYYLHLLDRVAGAAHFDVDEDTGRALISTLRAQLPGYLVPRLVRELPGAPGKTPIT